MFSYPVMEQFYTLQGEGRYSGQAAWFIRLGGCDVGCVWCDVKESWPIDAHSHVAVDDMLAAAIEFPGRLAVITGGEPALHNLGPLTEALHSAGFRTNIETSGSAPLSGSLDWITLSPKKFKSPLAENMKLAHELKIIVYNKSDFAWAQEHAAQVAENCLLYLQPEWSRAAEMTPLIIEYIKQHPRWQLSLQTHKYLNIP